jgi:hypothetical protein
VALSRENRGGYRPTAPQNNPNNISLTGGDGQNPKSPEVAYRGLGYRTTGETNKQAQAAPIKAKQTPPPARPVPRSAAPGVGVTGLTAESQFPEQSILEGTSMQNPAAAVMPSMNDNPDYQTITQYLPAMEWWASQPGTPQTTKDYVRYLRTII